MWRIHDLGSPGDRRQGESAGNPLGGDDQIGDDAFVIAREHRAGAGESGLHFVSDEHHALGAAPRRERGQETRSGNDESALALDGLDDHSGEVLRADLLFDDGDRTGRRGWSVDVTVAERVGQRGTVDLWGERPEPALVRLVLGGHRHREIGAAVVGVLEHHHRLPTGVRPRDLDGVLHRLGPGIEQRRALVVIPGSEPVERLGHFHIALVRGDHETGVGERLHLRGHRVHDRRRAVADGGDRDPGSEVDQ